ncbi:hypothetical protein L7F22_017766 [Adiantum nelumboides]|nr:hypothetical protein [Adiantum nelumboides]
MTAWRRPLKKSAFALIVPGTPHICSTKWVDSKVEVEGEDTGFARTQSLQRVLCRNFGLINLEELDKNYERDMYLVSGQETIDLDEFKEDIADLESSGENKDAARALMRVKQKLDGYEGGDMRSIEGQVQQLIQDAQDSDKLCQMYPGWGAWL